MRAAVPLLAITLLAGCATGKKMENTVSGRPEVTISGASQEAVQAEIFSLCNSSAAAVRSSSANEVVCGKPMEGGSAIAAQLLVGNSYSTPPVAMARFTIWKVGQDVRVSAYQWVETQMAMGQIRTVELNSPQAFNAVQAKLNDIKRRLASSPSPSQAPAIQSAAPGQLSREQWREQQLQQLQSETGLSYEEYQRRYRQIMSQ